MYVITGATGNTGTVVAEALLAKGEKVRTIARNAERLQVLASNGAEPVVCDMADSTALSKAFSDARAVYAMIPPNMSAPDFRAYQDGISSSLAHAIEAAAVKHAVSLSSVGADKESGTGPVVGLYHMEQKLNKVGGLSVLHLRAAYFMENTLAQIGIIQKMGFAAGPLRPDLKLPMIATRDIGAAAADAMLRLNFSSCEARELLGERDLSMSEATEIIGKAIGKPGLRYLHLSDAQVRGAMMQMGMSSDMAGLILEMAGALNSGHMRALETRSPQNTTPTSYETFVAEEFVPRYRKAATAA
jgi:uncharacterized protein YbjT (DUF2867 family)